MGGNKAKKEQKKQLLDQRIAEEDSTRKQLADDEAARLASADAIKVAGEREALSDLAQSEGARQARLATVQTDVEISTVSAAERARRRKAFQDGSLP